MNRISKIDEEYVRDEPVLRLFCVCYVTNEIYFKTVKQIWDHSKFQGHTLVAVCVPNLPKSADVEWELICVDTSINCEIEIKFEVFDNAEKYLSDFMQSESASSSSASRVFIDKESLQKPACSDLVNTLVAHSAVCVIPVDKVFNGSLAVCHFSCQSSN